MSKLPASVSLDADNLWSYMKTHGNPRWEERPSYMKVLTDRMLDVWGEADIKATVMVVGFDAARDGAELVSRSAAAGHEVGNHSYEHEPWLHRYSVDQLTEELAKTEEAIVAAGAPRPVGFRGPGYSLSPELLQLLADRGYVYDATTLPTWIGPVARAYYLRASNISAEERKKREALFGSAREVLRPNGPYRWKQADGGESLVELPVSVFPAARTPFHVSYLLHLLGIRESLAKAYFEAAIRAHKIAGYGPSVLLHPLDLLDGKDAPDLQFFPGMELPADRKIKLVGHVLRRLKTEFDLTGTRTHAESLSGLKARTTATAGPAGSR